MRDGRLDALLKTLWLSLFVAALLSPSCRERRGADRFSADVWDPKPYIPTSIIEADYASLDLESACVFLFQEGDIGFIRFAQADKWHARYQAGLLVLSNSVLVGTDCLTNGLAVLDFDDGPPMVPCGRHAVRWLSPTTLFFSPNMIRAAIVDIEAISEGNADLISGMFWTEVKVSKM